MGRALQLTMATLRRPLWNDQGVLPMGESGLLRVKPLVVFFHLISQCFDSIKAHIRVNGIGGLAFKQGLKFRTAVIQLQQLFHLPHLFCECLILDATLNLYFELLE